MPKIYFYDTGLLCFLLGIESAEHLSSSRLKGAIYENFAVGEVIKGRLNMGKEPATYFYREKKGLEVDILTMAADGKDLYEVKAGKTYQSDYSDNMKSVAAKLDDVISTIVIYDGKTIPGIALNIREL
jgi:predicted AAA+ superfamily ATPase